MPTTRPAQGDVFPATMATWIDDQLRLGPEGRRAVDHHIMSVYAWPMKVYFMGTRDRWLGEPDDVVQGFLADRLGKPEYFNKWRSSGLRLRHWLINGFCFYLKELRRAQRRTTAIGEDAKFVSTPDDPMDDSPGPTAAFDRALIVSFVREALKQTRETCEAEGLAAHFEVFLRHFYHGQSYGDFARDLGVDEARAAVMARTARTKFQAALRSMLSREGADIDEEIRTLLDA